MEKSKNKSECLLSIVIPVYNNIDGIKETIDSALMSVDAMLEVIVVDGASTDGTLEILKTYNDTRFSYISEADSGIYEAMNKGICKARGKFIGVLNSGDLYLIKAMSMLLSRLLEYDESCIVYTNQIIVERYEKISFYKVKKPGNIKDMDYGMSVFHEACFVGREIYAKVGLYDESLKVVGDMDFMLRCVRSNAKFIYHDINTVVFESGGVSSGIARYTEGIKLIAKYELPTKYATYRKILQYWLRSPIRAYYTKTRMERRRISESYCKLS